MSADMFLDLPTMSAPSGEERRTGAVAQVERAGLCLRRFSGAQPGVPYGACAAEAAASEALGLSVGGCTRARRSFGPRPRVLPLT